jgi:hypothetical protein
VGVPKLKVDESTTTCEICAAAKFKKLKLTNIRNRASRILELIHIDVMGRIDPPAEDDFKYELGSFKIYRSASAEGSYLRAFFGLSFSRPERVEDFLIEHFAAREPPPDPRIREFTNYVNSPTTVMILT